jgi:hypothetical protein
LRVRKRRRTERGGGSPPPDSNPFSDAKFKISSRPVKKIGHKPKSPIPALETPSASHQRAQRNAFCRGAHLQQRLFTRWNHIANKLRKAGWSWGWVSAIDLQGRTIWIVDAHGDDGRRFIVRGDEKLSAFVELERQVLTEVSW